MEAVVPATNVFCGGIVDTSPAVVSSSILSDLEIQIVPPESDFVSSLNSDIQIELMIPEVEISSSISMPIVFNGLILTMAEMIIGSSILSDLEIQIVPPDVTLTPSVDADFEIHLVIPESMDIEASCSSDMPFEFTIGDAVTRYFLIITGAQNATTDIEIPLKSFQARRRSGQPTYLSVVIPSVDYIDSITARQDGNIRIEQGFERSGVVLQRELIIETDIETVRSDEGGTNQSITLSGRKQTTYDSKNVTLTDATFRGLNAGKLRYRLAEPDIFLNPGDIVTIGDDTFTVGMMLYAISANMQNFEISEA
jgi:hypothetical protein